MHYFSVAVGRRVGIFESWSECKDSVERYPNAIYKKFETKSEALQFLSENTSSSSSHQTLGKRHTYSEDVIVLSSDESEHDCAGTCKIGRSSELRTSSSAVKPSTVSIEPRCFCGLAAAQLIVSKNNENKGRTFGSCPKRGEGKCKYFEWLSPAVAEGLASQAPPLSPEPPIEATDLVLYTDGACTGNVSSRVCPAGFGVVILTNIEGSDERRAIRLGELYGPICTDVSSSYFLGAEVTSNNTAELTAIGEALLWLRDGRLATVGTTAVIRYDSEYAAKSVLGIFNGTKNMKLISIVRGILRDLLEKGCKVRFSHVKGHSNHKWNDRADELATLGTTGKYCKAVGRFV